jgi:hypothetical protein
VNARAHQLGKKRTILNPTLAAGYRRLLEVRMAGGSVALSVGLYLPHATPLATLPSPSSALPSPPLSRFLDQVSRRIDPCYNGLSSLRGHLLESVDMSLFVRITNFPLPNPLHAGVGS